MKVIKTLFVLLPFLLPACQDWNYERVNFLQVITEDATEITSNTAVLKGAIEGLREGENVTQHGHVWSAETDRPRLEDSEPPTRQGQQGNGAFSSEITGLHANTLYYFCAYAVFNEQVEYGMVDSFRTENFSLFVEDIDVADGCARISWTINGYIGDPDKLGIVWSATNTMPVLNGEGVTQTEESSPFLNCPTPCPITEEDGLCNLESNIHYYVRPYLLPGDGLPPVYGEVVRFHTFPESVGWRRLRDLGGGTRNQAAVFVIEERAIIGGGGRQFPQTVYRDFWGYDPDNDTWFRKNDHPIPEHEIEPGKPIYLLNFSLGSMGYLMVGTDLPLEFWSYDPKMDTWHPLTKPNIFLRKGNAISVKDRGYYIDRDLNVLEFDPLKAAGDQWRVVDTISSPGEFIGAGGGKGYIIYDRESRFTGYRICEFDPLAPRGERFREMDDFPGQIWSRSSAFALNAKIYAGFGRALNGLYPREFWEFNPNAPAGQQWRRMPDFEGPGRELATVFSLGGKGYVFAGFHEDPDKDSFLKDLWEFTPPE